MSPDDGRNCHRTDEVNQSNAGQRVELALAYIRETEERLLRTEDRMRERGMPDQVRQFARVRAELMPVRAILRGE